MEVLESRQLLTTDTWINPAGGSWDVAGNWNNGIPGSSDDVVINDLDTGASVTISSNVETVNSITGTGPLSISGGGLTVTANSTMSGGLTMTGGSLTASGSAVLFTVTGTTTVNTASLYAQDGATLNLSKLMSYTGAVNQTTYLQAKGTGSRLLLTGLASITGAAGDCCSSTQVQAMAGGDLELPHLTQISGPAVWVESDGSGSTLDAPVLASAQGTSGKAYISGFQDSDGGTLLLPLLASCTQGTITVQAATLSLPELSDIDDSSVLVSPGTQLTLKKVTSYTGSVNQTTNLQVTGPDSLLSLPKLSSITGAAGDCCSSTQVQALAGGDLELPALTGISGPAVSVESNGSGSTLDVPSLASFQGGNGYTSGFQATQGGQIESPTLASLSGVTMTIDGTGTQDTAQVASFVGGTLTVSGGAPSFADLSDIDGSSVVVTSGSSLTLQKVTSYKGDNSGTTLEASDSGSVLSLPELATITGAPVGCCDSIQVEALAGGALELHSLTQISGPAVSVESDGAGSELDARALISAQGAAGKTSGLQASNGGTLSVPTLASCTVETITVQAASLTMPDLNNTNATTINVTGGATLTLPAPTASSTASGSVVSVTGTGSSLQVGTDVLTALPTSGTGLVINVPQLPQGMTLDLNPNGAFSGGTTFNVGSGAIVNIQSGTYGDGVTFNVGAGAIVNVQGGTYTGGVNVGAGAIVNIQGGTFNGGVTFNVGQGAVVDLTGGNAVTYSGTLTGSGAGTVELSSGVLYPAIGGVTLDFPGRMFQWTGGSINGQAGSLTNQGTINLAGSNEKMLYNDGTLDNFGTIIQTGTGNLGLHSDNQAPTILKIEPGASYLIESDSGVDNPAGGETEIENAGNIEKTAGTGTSTILVNGTLSNTGTIEAESGTLSLSATIAQVSGNTLTAGTWNAEDGSTLDFPNGTTIAANEASVTVSGSGGQIEALGGMTSNSGSFSLLDGAVGSTSGGLSDTGRLTIGAGSTLTVKGNYSQGSSASLIIGVGGAASGNEYGQLAITGGATFAGSVNASIASGFTPTAGASLPVVIYASETGGNSLSFGGMTSGGVSIFQPAVGQTSITLDTTTSPANLVVQPFSVAANAVVGQDLSVTYQVDNDSSNAVTTTWTDSVYLSTQTTLNANSVLLGRVQQNGVAANGHYSQTVTAPVPGLVPDNYYVIVLADSRGLVPEGNLASTELASTNPVQVTVPTLSLGTPISGTIADGQSLYYQVTVPAGQDVAISAGFAALLGGELYVGYQGIPSSSANLASSTSPTQTTQQVVIPDTQAGTYDILVQGDTGSGSGQPFTLSARILPLQVTGVGPSQAGDSGTTTLTIQGAEFTAGTTVSLVPHGGGSAIASSGVTFQSSTTLFAQFNLSGAAAGAYDVVVTSGGQKATDPSAFTVTSSAQPGQISYDLSVPSISRPGRIAYLTLTYSNDGGSDALAPLFVVSVTSGNATIGLPGETSFSGSSVQVLGIEDSGPAGTLPPGFQGTIEIPYESTTLTQGAEIDFSLQVLTGDSTPMDWSSLESSLQPSYIPNAAWPAVFANLTAEFGSTTASYLGYLDNEATYLSQLGEYTDDVQRLFAFAINTANDALTNGSLDSVTDASFPVPGAIPLDFVRQYSASISGRDTTGPFGLGWTDNWQIIASADSLGNVTISDDGSLLYFAKNSNGTYTPAPGEYGTLTLTNGAYQYVQTDGTIIAFNPNGSLNYEQDTNGNRIAAGYNSSGQLTSLTASNGSAITIAYNAQGHISSITAPGGQTTTYTYDASGQHLLTFTDVFGKTVYTYATGPTAADANALTSLTFADGTGIEWSYDAEGRLTTTGRLNGSGPEAEVETYAYPAPGEYTITNADNDKTATFNDDQGNLGETIDALGNITRYTYDANDNLTKVVAAEGTATTFTYDASGKLTSETDPLGYTISFTYNGFAEPLTFVNQEGYTTTYQYDANGNLLETINPDKTTQQYVYNSLGEVTTSTDPDSQTITYTYNTSGQLLAENLPGDTSDTYSYDNHGNMLTADSPAGDWSFTYNSQNLPTKIVEPYGTLTVLYGTDGNITQIVDQTGFTVNYGYDAVGRLSKLTDGNGNLIESYTYDPAGNLKSETKGNGTSTTYQYNADGDTTQITNLAPGGSINSQMTYAYSAVGEVTSTTTGGVTTAYQYDADGELISASSPGDTILYAYDPDGNRTSVTDNGVVTNYVSNDVNEYTSTTTNGVTTTYQYDANGNLIAATTGGQTTSYTFNTVNQLTAVSGPNGTFSYAYDALGYQISSTTDGQTTNNLIDPFGLGNVAAQFASSGNLIAHFTYGLGLVSQVTASGTADYYDYNLQGSTIGITNSAGAYVNQYGYDPFGQVTTVSAGVANPFTFVGQDGVSSDGNGLIYMRARYYDVSTGQFVSEDPLGFVGSGANLRGYAQNGPIQITDPLGLFPNTVSGWSEYYSAVGVLGDGLSRGYQALADSAQAYANTQSLSRAISSNTEFAGRLSEAFSSLGLISDSVKLFSDLQNNKNDNELAWDALNIAGDLLALDPAFWWVPSVLFGFEHFVLPAFSKKPGSSQDDSSENEPSRDPNDLLGPSGYGPAGYFAPGGRSPTRSNSPTRRPPRSQPTTSSSPSSSARTLTGARSSSARSGSAATSSTCRRA
jgi:RHS repeat-associated protein